MESGLVAFLTEVNFRTEDPTSLINNYFRFNKSLKLIKNYPYVLITHFLMVKIHDKSQEITSNTSRFIPSVTYSNAYSTTILSYVICDRPPTWNGAFLKEISVSGSYLFLTTK